MRQYGQELRRQLHRLLKRRFFRLCDSHIREISNKGPFLLSRESLDRLLSFIGDYNPYYRDFLTESCQLDGFPLLTKDIIRERFECLQTGKQTVTTYKNSSGGSTGRPVTLIQDTNFLTWSEAAQEYYFREFLGVERTAVRNVWLWGSDRDTLKLRSWRSKVSLYLQNSLFLNTFDMTEQRWLEYIERIKSYRPYYIAGYAGSLYEMARVGRKYNISLFRPKFIYSSAEMLRDFMREAIEEQFQTKVYDFYGSREVGAIAGESSKGRRHIFIMNNIVEIRDDADQPASSHQVGRIVVTNLHNYSMPLIRYDIGDTGVMSVGQCGCGSSLPVIEQLTGRVTDHFRLRDGTQIHGEFITHLFYFRDWVKQFQVDQVAYDYLRISLVPDPEFSEHDAEDINAHIRTVMGKDCVVEWRCVDSIEKTPQGKHLYTRCLINESTMGGSH